MRFNSNEGVGYLEGCILKKQILKLNKNTCSVKILELYTQALVTEALILSPKGNMVNYINELTVVYMYKHVHRLFKTHLAST